MERTPHSLWPCQTHHEVDRSLALPLHSAKYSLKGPVFKVVLEHNQKTVGMTDDEGLGPQQ